MRNLLETNRSLRELIKTLIFLEPIKEQMECLTMYLLGLWKSSTLLENDQEMENWLL